MKNINIIILFFGSLFLTNTVHAYQKKTDSLDIKIGQMLMVGFGGTHIDKNDPLIMEIKKGKIGGIILFEKNIDSINPYKKQKELILSLQSTSKVPLFIAIDQEGGYVNRLKTKYNFPKSVTAEYLGKLDNIDTTHYYAKTTAKTLASLGFNVNFSPVLDLSSNPNNPIIAKLGRSYSANPKLVIKHASIVIQEHSAMHIITVGKHFPGHGSSQKDSHKGMTDVTLTWRKNELTPYKVMFDKGILKGVMTAHIINKELDSSSLPSTLSNKIIDGILRKRLGYNGVVFSDDMQMHAITKHYGIENALILGINAGLDVLIFSNNIKASKNRRFDYLHSLIKKLVIEGQIKEERINQSYSRIMKLKKEMLY